MRGKQAAKAANRRIESTHEYVETLTASLTEAKARARRNEAAAERLPHVEKELARVRKQAAAGSSDALEREQERHDVAEDAHLESFATLLDLFITAIDRVKAEFTWEEYETLARLTGDLGVLNPRLGDTRIKRRNGRPGLAAFMKTLNQLDKHHPGWRGFVS